MCITLTGSLLAVIPKNIVHNVMGLALAMFGVTGIYLYLGSQFVAMMQLLIYVGAICVTYIFAIMLSPAAACWSFPNGVRPSFSPPWWSAGLPSSP